jgi:hypothetical protein
LIDLRKQQVSKGKDSVPQIISTADDLLLNTEGMGLDYIKSPIEKSLRTYLKYLYLDYPSYLKIQINGKPVDLKNPYSELKIEMPEDFDGLKGEKFAV